MGKKSRSSIGAVERRKQQLLCKNRQVTKVMLITDVPDDPVPSTSRTDDPIPSTSRIDIVWQEHLQELGDHKGLSMVEIREELVSVVQEERSVTEEAGEEHAGMSEVPVSQRNLFIGENRFFSLFDRCSVCQKCGAKTKSEINTKGADCTFDIR